MWVRQFFVTLLVCATTATTAFPGAIDLPIATPESQGLDSQKLLELCEHLNQSDLDIRALLILRNGRLVFERYEQQLTPDHNMAAYSVTKSVTSTLVGIAIDRKLLPSIDTPITQFFGNVRVEKPDERRAKITVKDLLTMSSGLEWTDTMKTPLDPGTNFTAMVESPDRITYVLNRPSAHMPGEKFNYSNGDAQVLAGIVSRVSKRPVPEFARVVLFDKLGFKDWEWVWPDQTGLHPGGYGLRLRPRDMAKFGQLFLQNGKWNDEQLVSAEWVRKATRTHINDNFGYYWWTHIKVGEHPTFTAIGFHGQFVCVIPDLQMVVVMSSNIDSGRMVEIFSKLLTERVMPAVASDAAIDANPRAVRALNESFPRANQIKRIRDGLSEDDTPRVLGR